jgi:hypothetical protein
MKRILLIGFWIFTATLVCSAQTTFYYPHVADGILGGTIWKTTIFLTNPSSSVGASGAVTFNKDGANDGSAGSPFPVSFTDSNGQPASSGNSITFSIPPGATQKYVSAGATAYSGGFAVVSTTAGVVSGTAIFSEFDLGGRLIGEAGVPGVSAVPRQAIFVDTQGGYNIGVAYANPGASSAVITLSLLSSSAATVMSTAATLGPGNHKAAFVTELFPGAPQLAGTMQLTSSVPLSAIALRFDPTFSVFTTLPPVTLASLINPALEWLQQRVWLTPLSSVARLLGGFQLRIG